MKLIHLSVYKFHQIHTHSTLAVKNLHKQTDAWIVSTKNTVSNKQHLVVKPFQLEWFFCILLGMISPSPSFKIKKQLPYGNRLFLLTCFTNSQSPDKEEGKSEQENQTCNSKSFQPSWKVSLCFYNKYIIQKRKERCCKE